MNRARQPLVDALKVLAAQCIVWHHLSAYGPLSDALWTQAPALADILYHHARKAVQVFLVVGGFLAAGTLLRATDGRLLRTTVLQRYRRLVPPFLVAMALAAAVATLLRPWLSDDLRLQSATLGTWLAHALLLHDIVEVPAIAAGAWYVAIDFQLYALVAGLAWIATQLAPAPRRNALALALLIGCVAVSLLHVNRHPDQDLWALYFIGSYGLGVLAAQAVRGPRWPWLMAIVAIGAAALAVEWRDRIALSLGVAVLLAGWARPGTPGSASTDPASFAPRSQASGAASKWARGWAARLTAAVAAGMATGADRSYALFLTHYSAVLVGNAALARWPALAAHAWALATACWAASLLLAWAFERAVERPLARRLR